jgi:hypothetical protein
MFLKAYTLKPRSRKVAAASLINVSELNRWSRPRTTPFAFAFGTCCNTYSASPFSFNVPFGKAVYLGGLDDGDTVHSRESCLHPPTEPCSIRSTIAVVICIYQQFRTESGFPKDHADIPLVTGPWPILGSVSAFRHFDPFGAIFVRALEDEYPERTIA